MLLVTTSVGFRASQHFRRICRNFRVIRQKGVECLSSAKNVVGDARWMPCASDIPIKSAKSLATKFEAEIPRALLCCVPLRAASGRFGPLRPARDDVRWHPTRGGATRNGDSPPAALVRRAAPPFINDFAYATAFLNDPTDGFLQTGILPEIFCGVLPKRKCFRPGLKIYFFNPFMWCTNI